MTQWTLTDAWVLGALGGTSAAEPALLWEVIARADAVEHAVLQEAEFTGSAGRLIAADLISTDGDGYWLTSTGEQLYAAKGDRKEALFAALRRLAGQDGEPLSLPAGAFEQAVDDYLAPFQQR